MTDNQQLIDEQFKRLPQEIQRALNTVPWRSSVKEIAITNKMSLEQVEIVERETMFILYGFEPAESYVANLMREAQIDEAVATAIAESVDEKIFKAIELQLEITPEAKPAPTPAPTPNLPQAIHNSLPMVEEGEVVHDVPHVETKAPEVKAPQPPIPPPTTPTPVPEPKKPATPTPNTHYEQGKDPYREPIV